MNTGRIYSYERVFLRYNYLKGLVMLNLIYIYQADLDLKQADRRIRKMEKPETTPLCVQFIHVVQITHTY
jgi:hypothetical protein